MIEFLFPLFGVVTLGIALSFLDHGIKPIAVAWLSLFTLFVGAATTIPIVFHLAMTWLMTLPSIGDRLHHVLHLNGVHLTPQSWLGAVAAFFILVVCVRLILLFLSWRRLLRANRSEIVILPTKDVFAYALPGKKASIVVSEGLKTRLSKDELEIVLAHERCHIEKRHDIWLNCGRICLFFNPLLVRQFKRLRHALERIADESAAVVCGDRIQVAHTISKVALNESVRQFSLGIASHGIPLRVQELMTPAACRFRWQIGAYAFGATGATLMCLLQWHHVVTAVATVCGL